MNGTISVLGCGWYGLPLASALYKEKYTVKGSTTNPEKITLLKHAGIEPFLLNFEHENVSYDPAFFDCQTLVICIPPKRSSTAQASFPDKIRNIAAAAENGGIKKIIFISSTAVYGDHNKTITEDDHTAPDTASGAAMITAENILLQHPSFKTSIIRFGGLIGPGRNPARFFAGKKDIPNGQAPVNLIHLEDCIGLTLSILKHEAFGHIFNACCPHHPSKQDFYKKAATRSGLEVPSFIDELSKWKIVSTRQIPSLLNYNYKITDLEQWLVADKL